MTQLSVFNFNQNEVRTVIKDDGEIWFVATDIAKVLEYRNAPDMVRNLDSDEISTTQIVRSASGGNPNITIISESGLYSATLKCRKPEAKQFKKWVTSDVLPSIRKNGGYIAGQENDDPELIIAKALQVAQNVIARKSKELEQANAEVKVLKPKANALDILSQGRSGYLCLTDAAKHLHIGRQELITILINRKIIYRRATSNLTKKGKLAAYDRAIQNGWMFHDYKTGEKPNGAEFEPQVLVTPKGMAHVAQLVNQVIGVLV